MYFTSNKIGHVFTNRLLPIILLCCFVTNSFAQQPTPKEESMVQKFYAINQESLYWFSSRKDVKRATEWLTVLGSADHFGFVSNEPQTGQIRAALRNRKTLDTVLKEKTDKQITAMVLFFIKNLQEGVVNFEYDEVSTPRDSVYIYQLRNSRYKGSVSKIVSQLDCKDHDYMVLKKYLHDSINKSDTYKYKAILLSMNYRKYLTINHQPECIVVNIPATEARYYRNDSLVIKMRTVVGKKKSPTPTIASYITRIITFPHWNVPHSIAVNELLPKVQKNENYLERNNFDVVDAKGNVIEDFEINWNDYTEKTFPYFFRQSTGAGNSLGVLKFDLQNPFSIFLHATSWQGAFAKDFRFLSHGCVRLERPSELADALLRGKLDKEELKIGKKDTESSFLPLPLKIPVFITYSPVTVEGNNVTFLPDVYGLIK